MASLTSSALWPRLLHMSWLLKSNTRLPSRLVKWTPSALSTTMGFHVCSYLHVP